ncbi:hypothetical protein GQ57_04125 [Burkholderia sp. MSh2]|nr:hypothetical protein GQ57_04125 [Burkholderia sp. MSh2]
MQFAKLDSIVVDDLSVILNLIGCQPVTFELDFDQEFNVIGSETIYSGTPSEIAHTNHVRDSQQTRYFGPARHPVPSWTSRLYQLVCLAYLIGRQVVFKVLSCYQWLLQPYLYPR